MAVSRKALAQFAARNAKRKPPPDTGPGQYMIPGYGGAARKKNVREQIRTHPYKQGDPYKVPDGSWHQPKHPPRGPTRRTPGASRVQRKPTWN